MKKNLLITLIFGLLSALWCAGLWAATGEDGRSAHEFHYRYVSLNEALPAGFLFFADPMKIDGHGRVYLNAWECPLDNCVPSIATYQGRVAKILHQHALFSDANDHGVIGGSVVNADFIRQAALFDDGAVKLIPRMQGEVDSQVMRITNSGIALVQWFNEKENYYLYKDGKVTAVDFGDRQVAFLDINEEGVIAGTFLNTGSGRAFRLNPFSRKLTQLNPLSTEPKSWGQAINDRGDVLGYSFISGGLERIGVWKGDVFSTYFVEGTPQFPTISNFLLWNKAGLIVITNTSERDLNSYLVPKPGIRLNLADLVDTTFPRWTLISSINKHGDMVGSGGGSFGNADDTFLLERIPGAR